MELRDWTWKFEEDCDREKRVGIMTEIWECLSRGRAWATDDDLFRAEGTLYGHKAKRNQKITDGTYTTTTYVRVIRLAKGGYVAQTKTGREFFLPREHMSSALKEVNSVIASNMASNS